MTSKPYEAGEEKKSRIEQDIVREILKTRARQVKENPFKREVIGGKNHEIACQSIWGLSKQLFLYIGQEYFFSTRL